MSENTGMPERMGEDIENPDYIVANPTTHLRFNSGILEQLFVLNHYAHHDFWKQTHEWRRVPAEAEAGAQE
jgi:hypothetical protein